MIEAGGNKPLITVVTVVFNSQNELENTILSIIGQSYGNIEYIIVDGGSLDGTLDIIKKYQDDIKIWISEPDSGVYDAMNKSLKMANGDFLIFMNSGDTFHSTDTVSNVVQSIAEQNSVHYGNAIYINKTSKTILQRGGYFSKYRLAKTNLCHQTIFYPKSVYKVNEYELKYKLYADWAYNIRLLSTNKFIYLDQDIVFFDTLGLSALYEDAVFKKDRLYFVYKFLGVDAIFYLVFNKMKNMLLKLLNKNLTGINE